MGKEKITSKKKEGRPMSFIFPKLRKKHPDLRGRRGHTIGRGTYPSR